MAKKSFVYRNIFIYRAIMNLLYLGNYKKRFEPVVEEIRSLPTGSRVLELCFGDILLADFCRKAGIQWTGLDINTDFVTSARKKGYSAHEADLTKLKELPTAELCVMMGSLYHFHGCAEALLGKMLKTSKAIVLSEPVANFSSRGGLIGLLARRGANAGKGNEVFRYNRETLMRLLHDNSHILRYRITSVQDQGKDLIVKLIKDENG